MSPVRDIPSGSEAVQSGIAANKKFRFDKNDTVHEGEGGTAPQGFGETVHEGERNTVPQGDGEAVREGERNTVPQGDGEAVCEGERETVLQGGEGGVDLVYQMEGDTVCEGEGGTALQGVGETVHEVERNTVPQGDGEAVREGERETVPQDEEEDQQSLSFEWSSICEFWKSKDSLNSESSLGRDIKSGASDKVVGIRGILDNSSQGSDLPAETSGMFLPAREDEKCGVCNLVKKKFAAMHGTLGVCKGQGYCGDEA